MSSGFALTPEALPSARDDVDRARAALSVALGDVRAEVTSLVGDGWRGGAATAFRSGFEEWQRGAVQVLGALTATGVALDSTQRSYTASDTSATDRLGRLSARLSDRLGSGG